MTARAKQPKKRKSVDWQMVRAEYEAGGPLATDRALAKRYGTSHTTVRKHRVAELWRQNLEPAVRRRMNEKLSETGPEVSTGSPEKTDAAVDAEATRRAVVVTRHRTEWDAARASLYRSMGQHQQATTSDGKKLALLDIRASYTAARTLSVIQANERRAWRIDDPNGPGDDGSLTVEWINRPAAGGTEDEESDDGEADD